MKKYRTANGLAATDILDGPTLGLIAAALVKKYPDKNEALTVAAALMQASENWSVSQPAQKSLGPRAVTPKVVESNIISDFNGLNHGNVFRLANGQIWEQTEYWIWVWIWVNPKVLIFDDGGIYRMKVDGIDHQVMVRRLK